MSEAAIRAAFTQQVGWCQRLGSPFTALICKLVAERLDRSTAAGRAILDWQGDPSSLVDNLPMRLTGSLHALVLDGASPELAAIYPPHPLPDEDQAFAALQSAMTSRGEAITARLKFVPQTNEVARSGPLMAGLLTIAHETRLPIALYELGPSAGLNLNLDRFAYDLGGMQTGDASSAVQIAPEWTGPAPPAAEVSVVSRRGVDLSPLSIENPGHRQLLMSYVWPDQAARLARLKAAMAIGLLHPPKLDQGDAADWTEQTLAVEPQVGVVRVLYHTIAYQYFPPAAQARIRDHAAKVGRSATAAGPFAWLRYEVDPEFDNRVSLRLTLWPNGEERVLGLGHPHGQNFVMF